MAAIDRDDLKLWFTAFCTMMSWVAIPAAFPLWGSVVAFQALTGFWVAGTAIGRLRNPNSMAAQACRFFFESPLRAARVLARGVTAKHADGHRVGTATSS